MTTNVHIPLTLRTSAEALADNGLDEAVRRAFARSLADSRRQVPDAGRGAPLLWPPDFHWTGATASVPAPLRNATEQRLRSLIERLALAEFPGARLADAAENAANGPATHPEWEIASVTAYDVAFVRDRYEEEFARQGMVIGGAGGLLVRGPDGWTILFSSDGFQGGTHFPFQFSRMYRRQPVRIDAAGRIVYESQELIPPMTAATLRQYALGAGEERLATLRQLVGPRLRAGLHDLVDPMDLQSDRLLTIDETNALVEQEIEAELARMASETAGRPYLLRIDWGEIVFNIAVTDSLTGLLGVAEDTAIPIVPALVDVEGAPRLFGTDAEANGSRPAARRNARDGGGGGGDGHGSRFGTQGEGGDGDGAARLFPGGAAGSAADLPCAPFENAEPALVDMGAGGRQIAALVGEIAERLGIEPCAYAGTFCLKAAASLAGLALATGMASGGEGGELLQPRAGGEVVFRPVASRGIQLLRRLAQAAARVSLLLRLLTDFYLHEGRTLLADHDSGEAVLAVHWVLHLREAVVPALNEGVGELYAQTCQLVMLQLLDASQRQIEARRRNLAAYAPVFRELLIRRLGDQGTLINLRDRLRHAEQMRSVSAALSSPAAAIIGGTLPQWNLAARALASSLHGDETERSAGAAFEIVAEGDRLRIRDEHGFLRTRDALERAIVSRRGEAESMDPLIEQLADLPETVERFRSNPDSAGPLLENLLDHMLTLNEEKRSEAADDPRFGLRAGRISESTTTNQVPGLLYQLGGVHLLAHEQIHSFFGSETACYTDGVSHIFAVELGIAGITGFFTFTGLLALAVLCPPAAIAAGAAVAAHDVYRAEERRELYQALINPELVLDRAEIELECYISYVGLALALLPEAGTAARAIAQGVRGAARGGLSVGLRLAGRSVVRQIGRQVSEQLARDLLPALLQELAGNLLMDQVIVPAVVGPLIESVERELRVHGSVGGSEGAMRLIDAIDGEAARLAAAPLPAELPPEGRAPAWE